MAYRSTLECVVTPFYGNLLQGRFQGYPFCKIQNEFGAGRSGWVVQKIFHLVQNDDVWSKPDRPLNERILQSWVFGTKWCVCKSLWADPEKGLVTLWGEKVLQGSITDGKLSIEYGEGWETYLHHKDYPEFKEMVNILTGKLKKRGKGKGESGGEFKGKFKGKI